MNYGSSLQRRLYFSSPKLVKDLLASTYGWRQRRLRRTETFRATLALLQDSQSWTQERLQSYQQGQTSELIRDALDHVPFYQNQKDLYRRYRAGADWCSLPVLRKDQVREHLREFYRTDLAGFRHRWKHTSGTTGKSLVFPVSAAAFQREYAYRAHHFHWAGVDLTGRDPIAYCQGHPVAHFDRSKPPFWVQDYSSNFLYFSSYHLSGANFPEYCDALDSFAPLLLTGYPSSIYLLALAYREFGRGRMRLRGIFTTSETVFPHQRSLIESVFGCKVFDAYGNSEMCGYGMGCEHAEMHMRGEHSLIEVLDEDDCPVRPGQIGRLVVTAFGNPAFPLIRYDTGDLATISKNQSSRCGRGGLLLDDVVGRVEDYVVAGDGRLVGRLDHLFKDSQDVIEAQVVQKIPGMVTLRLVVTNDYGPAQEAMIREEARLRLGTSTTVDFDYVPSIPRTANGKFRFVLSTVKATEALTSSGAHS